MEIISYKPGKHRKEIESWLETHSLSPSLVKDFPPYSYVASHKGELVAASGLEIGENVALYVGLVTNPKMDGDLRHEASDLLIQQIISKAKELGFKQLLAWTIDASVLKRAKKHGFKETSQIMLNLDLRGE